MALVRQPFYWEVKASIEGINLGFVGEAHEVLIRLLQDFIAQQKKQRARHLFAFNHKEDEIQEALEVLHLISHSNKPMQSLIGRLNLLCKLKKLNIKSNLSVLFTAFFSVYTHYLPFFRDDLYKLMAVDNRLWERFSLTAQEYKLFYDGEFRFYREHLFVLDRFRRYHENTKNELFDKLLQSLGRLQLVEHCLSLDEILWTSNLKSYLPLDKKPLFLSALMPLITRRNNTKYIASFKSWIVNDENAMLQIVAFQESCMALVKDCLLKGRIAHHAFEWQYEALRQLTALNHAGINECYYDYLVSVTQKEIVSKCPLAIQAMLFMDLSRFADRLDEEKSKAIVIYLMSCLSENIPHLTPPIIRFMKNIPCYQRERWVGQMKMIFESLQAYYQVLALVETDINSLLALRRYYEKREFCMLLEATIYESNQPAFTQLFEQSLAIVNDQGVWMTRREAEWECLIKCSHFFSVEQKKECARIGCDLFCNAPAFSYRHLKALVSLANYLSEKDKAALTEIFLTSFKQEQDYFSFKQKLDCLSSCQSVLLLHGVTWGIVGEAFMQFTPQAMLDEAIKYLDKWSPPVRKHLIELIFDEPSELLFRIKEAQWEKIRLCVTPSERVVMMGRLMYLAQYMRPAYHANYFIARLVYDDFFHDHQQAQKKQMMASLLDHDKAFAPLEEDTFSDIKQAIMRLM